MVPLDGQLPQFPITGVYQAGCRCRRQLAAACTAHVNLGPATLVLYDVSTLYFEIDQGHWVTLTSVAYPVPLPVSGGTRSRSSILRPRPSGCITGSSQSEWIRGLNPPASSRHLAT